MFLISLSFAHVSSVIYFPSCLALADQVLTTCVFVSE